MAVVISGLALVVSIIAAWIARLQLGERREATKSQNFIYLMNYLNDNSRSDARQALRLDLATKPYGNWTADDKRAARVVCASYDLVGTYVRADMVNTSLLFTTWGSAILPAHEWLKPFLDDQQGPNHTGRTYWHNFDWLSETQLRPWFQHNRPLT
jgi:hypothetical protein